MLFLIPIALPVHFEGSVPGFFCIISISRYMRIAYCIDKKAQTVHQPALFVSD